MKEARYFYVPDAGRGMQLPDEEAQHAVRVLRMQSGDEMMLMDGEGSFFRAEVTLASNHHCGYRILETLPQQPQWEGRLSVAVAPTKLMDRMEWFVEKAVEIGVDQITVLDCQFSERRVVKLPRLDKIVVSAMKQSRKAWKTRLCDMTTVADFISQSPTDNIFIAHCYEEIPRTYLYNELRQLAPSADVAVLIGPEGDFSIDEVRQAVARGCKSVHLGSSRLRTETAALSAVMMMQLSKN
ncbi:MAG: 16S rRNA (uracil(1498)-N(3))-methyltransferase [Prevotella sp.]|nr:16S rRNA (uracil(1498)-N(3))-methyltransferase [Prevotella sp.]